ncbi:hypothetical protein TRFO_39271 [Tritrichomonas foetus]|uniref:Protein kinase domain-containing protein n=1 Tax=Tritrichomonas foetus TaxID=1144522 RepID=A0A1J4J5N4_9EUKA|nr:hypothetical protein TRFO_39271 [Tritrichomonas foetus]|eukprot:OHS94546.1 hypothetical protein TRFO_39271 [Tritrichomonas foetus]
MKYLKISLQNFNRILQSLRKSDSKILSHSKNYEKTNKQTMVDLVNSLPFSIDSYDFISYIGRGSYSYAFEVRSHKYERTTFCGKATPLFSTADCNGYPYNPQQNDENGNNQNMEDENHSNYNLNNETGGYPPEMYSGLIDENGNVTDMELYALTLLDHPNIIRVYDYFASNCYLFLILEYCNGGTLQDKINNCESYKKGEAPDPQVVFKIVESITSALKICHNSNIAHRDIKPENIFFDEYNRPKLADFGLSSLIGNDSMVNEACGSIGYLAPEIFANSSCPPESQRKCENNQKNASINIDFLKNSTYDPYKADIWSLGVTFYVMLTGHLPFTSQSSGPANKASLKNPLRVTNSLLPSKPLKLSFPPNVDPRLAKMITSMLIFDPECRPSISQICQCEYIKKTNIIPPLLHSQSIVQIGLNRKNKKISNSNSSLLFSMLQRRKLVKTSDMRSPSPINGFVPISNPVIRNSSNTVITTGSRRKGSFTKINQSKSQPIKPVFNV